MHILVRVQDDGISSSCILHACSTPLACRLDSDDSSLPGRILSDRPSFPLSEDAENECTSHARSRPRHWKNFKRHVSCTSSYSIVERHHLYNCMQSLPSSSRSDPKSSIVNRSVFSFADLAVRAAKAVALGLGQGCATFKACHYRLRCTSEVRERSSPPRPWE